MKIKSIQAKIAFFAGSCLLVTVGVILLYSVWSVHSTALENARDRASGLASEQAAKIEHGFDESLRTVTTIAETLTAVNDEKVELDISREAVIGILEIVLSQNSNLAGVFTAWESEAFDGMDSGYEGIDGYDDTGRFIPYCFRKEDGMSFRPLENFESEEPGESGGRLGDFYLRPKESRKRLVSEPTANGNAICSRISVPILGTDAFYGIAGADMHLDFAQDVADALDAFHGSARLFVFSARGTLIAATGRKDLVGKPLSAVAPEQHETFLRSVQAHRSVSSMDDGALSCVVPCDVGNEVSSWGALVQVPEREITAVAARMAWTQLAIGLGCSIVAIGLVWLIASRISVSVRSIVERLQDIAEGEGDLTLRIKATANDETGELCRWFNMFVDKIHETIKEVAVATEEVAHAATDIAAASEETSVSLRRIADSATDVAQNAKESGSTAEGGGRVVEETIADIKTVQSAVDSTSSSIQALGERGEQIGQVISAISQIASQTNLLALNATIEAARAGEQGRGFAVVADEVRRLAERTGEATADISDIIKGIQGDTNSAVDRIRQSSDQVDSGVKSAGSAGDSLSEIVQSTHIVAEKIESIAAITKAAGSASVSSSESAARMTEMSERLLELVGRFRV